MATKDKSSPSKKAASTSKVTRIKATDTKTPKKAAAVASALKNETTTRRNPLAAIGAYFTGAWYELRQVRWPNRRATWSLTLAVIAFTAFFVALILLLDALFKYLFEIILG